MRMSQLSNLDVDVVAGLEMAGFIQALIDRSL